MDAGCFYKRLAGTGGEGKQVKNGGNSSHLRVLRVAGGRKEKTTSKLRKKKNK